MFQKITMGATFALMLAACATPGPHTESRATHGELHIRGELVDSTDVHIFVNGDKVIDDRVSLLHGDGDFTGIFNGKPVRASCSTRAGRKLDATSCVVAVAGKRVTLVL